MKALVKQQAAPGIWLEDIPEPKVGHNDVLIEIAKTAICGTDMHIYNWDAWAQKTIPVPMAVGHEYCGRIVELGSEVKGLKKGDRVSGEGHITCGYCRNCRAGRRHLCRNTVGVGVNRPGAFAQYLAIPADNTFKLTDSIPDDIAAILDPFGNATHTALAFNVVGEDVLITGAGPIALLGIPHEETAIDWTQVIFKGLTLKGIYGREMFETWYKMASLLQSGLKLEPVITHHFRVQEFLKGFETMGSGKSGKVILDWSTL